MKYVVNLWGLCKEMLHNRKFCVRSESDQILAVFVGRGWRREGTIFKTRVFFMILWLYKDRFREGKAVWESHLSGSAQSHHFCAVLGPGHWQTVESFFICDMFHLLLLIFNYRSVDSCRGLGERMCCGLGCKHSADTFELTSSVHLLVIWRIWKWWLKHSLLNLYFYSPDPRNVVPFTEVHTRAVLAEKGPFSGLAKCWRTYFLGDVVFQGKKFTVPSSTVYTSCLFSSPCDSNNM